MIITQLNKSHERCESCAKGDTIMLQYKRIARSPFLLNAGSRDTVFIVDIHSVEPVAYEESTKKHTYGTKLALYFIYKIMMHVFTQFIDVWNTKPVWSKHIKQVMSLTILDSSISFSAAHSDLRVIPQVPWEPLKLASWTGFLCRQHTSRHVTDMINYTEVYWFIVLAWSLTHSPPDTKPHRQFYICGVWVWD